MIEVYAILNNQEIMEIFIAENSKKFFLTDLVQNIFGRIRSSLSHLVHRIQINGYQAYYFTQETFTFILVTTIHDRVDRMKSYLRVIAEIFYENYDEFKFKFVLNQIMNQVNRLQFLPHPNQNSLEDQESFLVLSSVQQSKQKINRFINQSKKTSSLAYIISVILFISITILAVYYLLQKWK